MLCSSPITSFCEDHVLFLLIHLTGVLYHLFNIFSSHQVFFSFLLECCPNSVILVPWLSHYTEVVIFFSFVKLLFSCFSTYKVLVMVLVPLAERSVLNFVHLRRVISSSFATSQGSLVSLVCQRSNLFYLFPFRFSPVPS